MYEEIGRLRYSCKYPGCQSSYYTQIKKDDYKNKKFYRFPKDVDTHNKWVDICNIPRSIKSSNFMVCEDHFEARDFVNESRHRINYKACPRSCSLQADIQSDYIDSTPLNGNIEVNSTNVLSLLDNESAHPNYVSILIKPEDTVVINSESSKLSPNNVTVYKLQLKVKFLVCKLRKLLAYSTNKMSALKKESDDGCFLSVEDKLKKVSKQFFKTQFCNVESKAKCTQWSSQDKACALSIYKRNPLTYKYLCQYLELPPIRTLKELLSRIPLEPGNNGAIFENLESKVNGLVEADRYCTLAFHKVSLSSDPLGSSNPSNHVLIFMIRGIRRPYKQVISYYFTPDTISTKQLKDLIAETIRALLEIGLKVICTVCDQSATNRTALSQLCKEMDHFFIFDDKVQIFVIFDVPHLLKSTRDCLIKCKIEFAPNKFAKMEYIEQAFQLDEQYRRFKLLPKLKAAHFNFEDGSSIATEVKVAAQQLSRSVAVAIETFVSLRLLPTDALDTAEFVETINKLFDSLNNSSFSEEPLKAPSQHVEFWQECLREMPNWNIIDLDEDVDVTNEFNFLTGWQATIKSMLCIWETVKDEGFECLCTRSFNLDHVENILWDIRQHGASPNCSQFTAALKSVAVNKFSTFSEIKGKNCEDDHCPSLTDFAVFLENHAVEDSIEDADVGVIE